MDSDGYKQAWVRPSTLESLNRRIHDGVPLEELGARAADRRDTFFELLFPYARPAEGSKVLELGPGVGWIMEAMLDRYPIGEITGLDVSPVMIEQAQERWHDDRAKYVLYDGLHVPLEALRVAARRRPDRARGAADATPDEQRILRNFVVDGRLVRLPARHAQKQVVLGYVARRFEESRDYEEREVNELLRGFHDDTASLRRYLVDEGMLEREAGVYRRA